MCVRHAVLLTALTADPRLPHFAQFWCNATPFKINTCKSASKQTTLTSFRITTFEKTGEGYTLPNQDAFRFVLFVPTVSVVAPSTIFRTHFQVAYPASPFFATLTKTPGVWGYSSRFGTHHSHSPSVVSFHPVNIALNETECRVLGALVEKEITTPEYYPLSLNALVNACNQKSNREPVMNLDEPAVRQALHSLDGQSLVRSVSASDSRVTKYEHRLQEAFNFYRHEIAILCVLLLRGPQTPGELRTRTERMHSFYDLSAVQSSLNHLMKREPPIAKVLPRQPGTKEARYAHLLAGDVDFFESKLEVAESVAANSADAERVALLEKEVAALHNDVANCQKEIADLRQQFAQFKKQFE